MSTPFDFWSIEDARIAAQLATERAGQLDSYRKYLAGDHFQNWAGWTGPIPDPLDPAYATMSAEIIRGFVSQNVLGEVVGRHQNGVLGRDVKYSFVPRRKLPPGEQPTAEESALIDEATDLLTEWVEARKLNQEFDEAAKTLLLAGIAYARPFVPPGELTPEGTITGDLATNLGRVYVHFPQPGEAVLYTDPRTQAKCSVYLYREQTGNRPSQTQGQQGEERAELTYLDGDQTVIRILKAEGGSAERMKDEAPADWGRRMKGAQASPSSSFILHPSSFSSPSSFSFSLGNRLLMWDMQRPPLITESVVSQQKLLNKTLSMKSRNMDMAGFRERVTTNAQMGGTYQTVDGKRVFVADTMPVGPSSQTNLTGYILRDKDGKETIVTPSVQWIDPVPVASFLETERSAYHAILAECNQLHYAMADDAVASGTSRETAMAAYLVDLLQTKQQVDAAWAWLLETVLALAATLSGEPGRFDSIRCSAEATVDAGPASVESMRAAMELTGGQPLLSVKTAMSWCGVEDIPGEAAAIAEEAEKALERQPDLGAIQGMLDTVRGGGAGGSTGSPTGTANGAQNGQLDGQAQGVARA